MKLSTPTSIRLKNEPSGSVSRVLVPTILALAMFPASFTQAEQINYPDPGYTLKNDIWDIQDGYLYPDLAPSGNTSDGYWEQ